MAGNSSLHMYGAGKTDELEQGRQDCSRELQDAVSGVQPAK